MIKVLFKASVFAVLASCLVAAQSSKPSTTSAASFTGEWRVGLGAGGSTFLITLEKGGKASKSHGSPNGTWTVFGDEARITWSDGWHDVIRRAGNKWEKAAYAPGKSFSDPPDNITGATRTEPL
jgi:hypothetical protein